MRLLSTQLLQFAYGIFLLKLWKESQCGTLRLDYISCSVHTTSTNLPSKPRRRERMSAFYPTSTVLPLAPPAVSFIPLPGSCSVNPVRVTSQKQVIPRPKRPRAAGTPRRCRDAIRADYGPPCPDRSVSRDLFSHIMDLEDALDDAVDAEEYTSAAGIRDQLTLAKNEDSVLILSAHLSYYDAFNEHSLERLSSLWHNNPSVICQHPLSACHIGYDSVMSSFATLFSTLPADLAIEVSDVRIATFGPAAYVTCIETPKSSMLPVGKDGRERHHGLQATSVFEKHLREDGTCEYLMVHHVSAPIFSALSVL